MTKKIILSVLLLVIFFSISNADESKSKNIGFFDFSGGLISHANVYATKENAAFDVRNARFNERLGSIVKRNYTRGYGEIGNYKVTGLHRFYKANGDKFLLSSGSTFLKVGDDSTGEFIVLKDGLTDSRRFNFVTYKDIAIAMNGIDSAVKYDGHIAVGTDDGDRSENNLCADLGAPFATLTASGNLSASNWYQYKVLFKDADGLYYYTDAKSNAIQCGTTATGIYLTDIPLGRKDYVSERQIYRTKGNATETAVKEDEDYYYVTTLSDNSTREYSDITADASITIELSTTGHIDVTPPIGKYSQIHAERFFISGNNVYASDLYWSDYLNPDFFLPNSFIQVRPDDGDKITFIKAVLGTLAVSKNNSIQKFYTQGAESTWELSGVLSPIGCVSPYSAATTPVGIIYVGKYGLYRFDGQSSYLISDKVTPQIRDILQTSIDECFGILWNNEYQLAYTSLESGDQFNNRLLVYDLTRDTFTLDNKNVNVMTTLESGTDFGLLYYGSSINGGVSSDGTTATILTKRYKSELEEGTYDDTRVFGTEISPFIELAWDVTGSACNLTNSYPLAADMTSNGGTTWLGARPSIDGDWTSPAYQINADSFNKLYWNELLGVYGDITAQVRSATESGTISLQEWSAEFTDPSGSDISSLTASNYVQIRFNLDTINIQYTPKLFESDNYVFKLTYEKAGSVDESIMNMFYDSGWRTIGNPGWQILLKRIRVYFRGDEGEFTLRYYNNNGDIDNSFDVDLSVTESTPRYTGDSYYNVVGDSKVYTYYPAHDTIGDLWRFTISDENAQPYEVERIEVILWHEEYSDF